jgi:hypothetical protein
MDDVTIELVGEGSGEPVIVLSFVDRGRAMAISDREFVRALRILVARAKAHFPGSRLRDVVVPTEH